MVIFNVNRLSTSKQSPLCWLFFHLFLANLSLPLEVAKGMVVLHFREKSMVQKETVGQRQSPGCELQPLLDLHGAGLCLLALMRIIRGWSLPSWELFQQITNRKQNEPQAVGGGLNFV